MRHLGSLLLALLAAPVAFVLAGRGLGGLAEVAAKAPDADRTDHFAIASAAAALVLAGVLFALLTMARIGPLGPAVAGLGYLAVGIAALADPRLLAAVPGQLVGLDDERLLAAATVSPLLAVPLLVPVFLPGRWQGSRVAPRRIRVVLPRRPAPPPPPPFLGRPPPRPPLLPRPAPPPPPPAGPEPPSPVPPTPTPAPAQPVGPEPPRPAVPPAPPTEPEPPPAPAPVGDPATDPAGEPPGRMPPVTDPGPATPDPAGSG